ncbi:MAG TPA: MFS transporter [Caulobacteraceae bacterium]|nr:MFS transporter [Caulobacteraceae bacterium]
MTLSGVTSAAAAARPADVAGEAAADSAPWPGALYAWFVVAALSLANMVSYVERQILTLLFTPIKHDFRLSDTEVSLLAGAAFVLFYVGFGLVIGRLADRTSRRRIIMTGVVFWSLATTACGLAQNFTQLFVARISVGVGEATLGPSALSIIGDCFPRAKLARAISVYTGAQYVGAGLALVVGGMVIALATRLGPDALPFLTGLRPWQMTFVIIGVGGMAVLIPLLFVREPQRRGLAPVAGPEGGVSRARLFAFLGENRRMFGAHFAAFSISSMLGFGTVAWVPTFFVRHYHWPASRIGFAYGLMLAILGGAGVLAGARVGEWMERRGVADACLRLPMISMSAASALLVAALLWPSEGAALGFLAVSTFLSSFPVSLIIAALQMVTPNQMRGQVVALYYFIANVVGVATGPTVVALLTDHLFRDEGAVGYALATAAAVITPVVVVILGFGLRGYRETLARTAALHGSPA